MITDINQLDFSKKYTYADYLTWQFKERVELIRGRVFELPPAPNRNHQKIVGNVSGIFWSVLKGKTCSVYPAPFDVRLPFDHTGEDITTVVQPDVSVICDPAKLDEQGCMGAPDLIVEVLSPGNSKREVKDKYELYEQNGVQQYWIVYPAEQILQIYHLKDDKYVADPPLTDGDSITVGFLEQLSIPVTDIFE